MALAPHGIMAPTSRARLAHAPHHLSISGFELFLWISLATLCGCSSKIYPYLLLPLGLTSMNPSSSRSFSRSLNDLTFRVGVK
jgi:hypothetical protein